MGLCVISKRRNDEGHHIANGHVGRVDGRAGGFGLHHGHKAIVRVDGFEFSHSSIWC